MENKANVNPRVSAQITGGVNANAKSSAVHEKILNLNHRVDTSRTLDTGNAHKSRGPDEARKTATGGGNENFNKIRDMWAKKDTQGGFGKSVRGSVMNNNRVSHVA